jgi:hypothetical protein
MIMATTAMPVCEPDTKSLEERVAHTAIAAMIETTAAAAEAPTPALTNNRRSRRGCAVAGRVSSGIR